MINKRSVREFFILTFGTAIVAVAVYFFMLPSHITIGSGSALAMVLSNFIPLPVSVITFALNIVLLTLGFLLIGPEFGAKTVYSTLLMPAMMRVFEIVFPDFQSLTGDAFLDTLGYILVVGIGIALLFSCNASSGGLDIVAKLMNRYLRMDLGQAMSVSGLVVALSGALCYDKKTVVISLIGTYFGGIIVDHFIFGLNIKRRVCILSPKVDEITQFILHDLHSGASLYDAIGAYDNVVRREIITIVDNQEYKKLMDYVKKTDPTAFVTVYSVNEINYQPKPQAKKK